MGAEQSAIPDRESAAASAAAGTRAVAAEAQSTRLNLFLVEEDGRHMLICTHPRLHHDRIRTCAMIKFKLSDRCTLTPVKLSSTLPAERGIAIHNLPDNAWSSEFVSGVIKEREREDREAIRANEAAAQTVARLEQQLADAVRRAEEIRATTSSRGAPTTPVPRSAPAAAAAAAAATPTSSTNPTNSAPSSARRHETQGGSASKKPRNH